MQNFNQQSLNERIDNQIAQLQQMKNHNITQPAINQTFQIAPQNMNGIKIVNGIEDVQKELTISETPFLNKDYSMMWIKNAKGEIRTFNLEELKPKDEKDLIIDDLQNQIVVLNRTIREMRNSEHESDVENRDEYESEQLIEPIKNSKSTNVSSNSTSKSKSK